MVKIKIENEYKYISWQEGLSYLNLVLFSKNKEKREIMNGVKIMPSLKGKISEIPQEAR